VDALENTQEEAAIKGFEHTFAEYGLPSVIRTDNGVPFSTRTIFGLSRLSVWWLRLGIKLERIQPGHPEQNGRHERMHLTLKQTLTPPAKTMLQQQEMFDGFIETFNNERPHDGIAKRCPGEVYQRSARALPTFLPDLVYPDHDQNLKVRPDGSIYLGDRRKVHISSALRDQNLGIRLADERLWEVTFMNYVLGYFDDDSLKFSPQENALITEEKAGDQPQVSPMSPE